jgi:cytochrome P450
VSTAASCSDDDGGATSNKTRYTIPKGSTVALTHIATSLDTGIWGDDAASFNVSEGTEQLYRDEYRFTAFSHGIHKCPGQQLALLLMEGTLAILLTDHDVTFPTAGTATTPTLPPLCFERATLAQRRGPVRVSIARKAHAATVQ